jgi:hypothetical protein
VDEATAAASLAEAAKEFDFKLGLDGFEGNSGALWVTAALFVLGFPGLPNLVSRTGQAKYVDKTYVMPGPASGGLEMRAIAGGVVAYFRTQNYVMEDSPQKGKIRFIGNLEGSVSQAFYVVGCCIAGFVALAIFLQGIFPYGPAGLGPNFFFAPVVFSPIAGFYYWDRAFRQDIVELSLEDSDDQEEVSLNVLGDKDTIELLQTGVKFQNRKGQLFQLMEKGMEYVPGIFEAEATTVIKDADKPRTPVLKAETEPVAQKEKVSA